MAPSVRISRKPGFSAKSRPARPSTTNQERPRVLKKETTTWFLLRLRLRAEINVSVAYCLKATSHCWEKGAPEAGARSSPLEPTRAPSLRRELRTNAHALHARVVILTCRRRSSSVSVFEGGRALPPLSTNIAQFYSARNVRKSGKTSVKPRHLSREEEFWIWISWILPSWISEPIFNDCARPDSEFRFDFGKSLKVDRVKLSFKIEQATTSSERVVFWSSSPNVSLFDRIEKSPKTEIRFVWECEFKKTEKPRWLGTSSQFWLLRFLYQVRAKPQKFKIPVFEKNGNQLFHCEFQDLGRHFEKGESSFTFKTFNKASKGTFLFSRKQGVSTVLYK